MNAIKQHVFVERRAVLNLAHSCGLGIIAEEEWLEGYQLYVVEQWICDRGITSNAIKVFTGDPSHRIKVCVIAISDADLQNPSADLQSHLEIFKSDSSLKPKSTRLGEIMLTDPSEFSYDMDMVLIPDGDYEACVKQVFVNINLRRCNCTGRSALNLNQANQASQDKFRSLYKISDIVPFDDAVINLVLLAQTALYLFNLLKKEYIDGLLCNDTQKAFGIFYKEYHPVETQEMREPWMEPHLLTALITKLLMCRQKLQHLGYTTIKDPFTEFENFGYNIAQFQKAKGIPRTTVIDLRTLEKLDQYTLGPLKVRKAIKSKLDDISGINNSPLINESSDPEIFSKHATIDSLRIIWRPRLKSIHNYDADFPVDWLQGSKTLLKGVSARTTKTSEVAAGMISKVAGSFGRITSNDNRNWFDRHNSGKNAWYNYTMNDNMGWTHNPALDSRPTAGRARTNPIATTSQTENIVATGSAPISPQHSPRLPSDEKFRFRSPPLSPLTNLGVDELASDSDDRSSRQSIDLLEQEIPSYALKKGSKPSIELPSSVEPLSRKKSQDGLAIYTTLEEPPSTDTLVVDSPIVKAQTPQPKPLLLRSASDSLLPTVISSQQQDLAPNYEHHAFAFSDTDDADNYDKKSPLIYGRAHSFTSVPMLADIPRRDATMDVKTYILYEKLLAQQAELTNSVKELESISVMYQEQAQKLKMTWLHRKKMFEATESAANDILAQQENMDNGVKGLEDSSAKLHYELNVINDKLKDVEENVTNFYSKVESLERKMHESQRSVTTMLIVGNYFNHYFEKIKNTMFGLAAATPFAKNAKEEHSSPKPS